MKKRFTEKQIIGVLKDAGAGLNPAELCHKHGVSATFYNCKAKLGGMMVSDAQRLKAGAGEQQAQAPAGRFDAGHCGAEGSAVAKIVARRPGEMRSGLCRPSAPWVSPGPAGWLGIRDRCFTMNRAVESTTRC
ncbi:transposase [Cupriavidus plantarum]|uniref:transposase n=1 Tax=Cupriavidus plantarum TaxID=942865 RepID=UPI00339D94F9